MGEGHIHRFDPNIFYYTYGPHEPVLRIKAGDTLMTTTIDAYNRDKNGDEIPRSMRQHREDTSYVENNPLTGPFFVEEAEVGDTLIVDIEEININRDTSYGFAGFDHGGLAWGIKEGVSLSSADHSAAVKEYLWHVDVERQVAAVDLPDSRVGSIEIPLSPNFGCMGVAPRWGEIISSITPSHHGGNLDCVETGPGTRVYLPVFVNGAYLLFGDVHAAQGDGEICGAGFDVSADVVLKIDLRKGSPIDWPRLENEEYIMVAASTRPLIDAYRLAQVELIKWLEEDYGYDPLDSLNLLTHIGESRIGNVVNPLFTVVAKFPKRYLP